MSSPSSPSPGDSSSRPIAEPSEPRRNIELKARLASIDDAREIAGSIATEHLGQQTQVDTYFRCAEGRLKLRVSNQHPAQLVSYSRDDIAAAKPSDYRFWRSPTLSSSSIC